MVGRESSRRWLIEIDPMEAASRVRTASRPPRAVVERGPDRPWHGSDALDEEPVRARRRQPQRFQRTVLLRVVPALGRLEARELENHRKRRLRALHDVELAAGDEDASIVLLNRGQDALAVLPHLRLIGDLEHVEHCIRWHGRLLVGTVVRAAAPATAYRKTVARPAALGQAPGPAAPSTRSWPRWSSMATRSPDPLAAAASAGSSAPAPSRSSC